MRRWTLLLILLGLSHARTPGLVADDGEAPETAPQEPTVLEPATTPVGPVTRLAPDGPNEPWDPREIGEFSLLDQDGNMVTKDDLLGTPWVASFFFTRCQSADMCPRLVRSIYETRKKLADVDVRFVTITVDPEYDTVDQIRRYADIYEAEPPGWLFLTGEKDEIYRLAQSGFRVAAADISRAGIVDFAHSLKLIHVDAEGGIEGMYSSSDDGDLLVLEQVLLGRRETPPEFRPVPPPAEHPAVAADSQTAPTPPSPEVDDPLDRLPGWAQRLPTTNAMLNTLATLLLLVGFSAIKAGQVSFHRRMMLTAFGVSIAFLACYLTYHFALHHYTGTHGKRFEGSGALANAYYVILISHVVLAAAVPVLASVTIYRGLTGQIEKHRRIARITFPIWLYVSVTGVIIYWMLYQW